MYSCIFSTSIKSFSIVLQDVSVCFYDGPVGPLLETVQLNESNGVWSVTGPRNWENLYYLYEVTVYHPATSQVEKCLADDPYARGWAFWLLHNLILPIEEVEGINVILFWLVFLQMEHGHGWLTLIVKHWSHLLGTSWLLKSQSSIPFLT